MKNRASNWGVLLLLCMCVALLTLLGGDLENPPAARKALARTESEANKPENLPSFGYIDSPTSKTFSDPLAPIQGWALDIDGVEKVKLRIDGKIEVDVPYGLVRSDVVKVHPDYPNAELSGFAIRTDLSRYLSDHTQIDILVIDQKKTETNIGSLFFIASEKKNRWRELYERNVHWGEDPFYVLHATSGVANGGARGLAKSYSLYTSPTVRIGLRVPILYMRSTLGKDADWVFDPAFDSSRTYKGKRLVDDSLKNLIDFAIAENLAILFTLNGGVWGDAFGTAPDWDLNDHLEEDPDNCQWSQYDEVFADDYLKGLSGSTESPELARVLSLNAYAPEVRWYKKRNLQAAGAIVKQFQQANPDLFAGINLDADTYANPFFDDRWHDYNPKTIRQFREWLQGTRLYAPKGKLASYRRSKTFTLAKLNAFVDADFSSWDEVDPPRGKPSKGNLTEQSRLMRLWLRVKRRFVDVPPPRIRSLEEIAALEVPWIRQWELFRRHLVDLHYDELSLWLTEIGIDPQDIYSSQGFSAPHVRALPFAVYLDSPVKNYDSGGMSIEGSVPRAGHLGVIIYGSSASNNIRMETDSSLFEAFYTADPDWGIVEYNTSDFRDPGKLAGYARAYRSLRDLYNYQARFISAMAWNGSNGEMVGKPGFAAHTALRNTPMELAIKDFMISRAYLPRNALMWEFGTARHLDFDRWTATKGAIGGNYGSLIVKSREGRSVLVSPDRIPIKAEHHDLLVLGIKHRAALDEVEVMAHTAEGKKSVSGPLKVDKLGYTAAGIEIPIDWQETIPEQGFDIIFSFSGIVKQFQLDHIVLVGLEKRNPTSDVGLRAAL